MSKRWQRKFYDPISLPTADLVTLMDAGDYITNLTTKESALPMASGDRGPDSVRPRRPAQVQREPTKANDLRTEAGCTMRPCTKQRVKHESNLCAVVKLADCKHTE
jgi:hypothetical protein